MQSKKWAMQQIGASIGQWRAACLTSGPVCYQESSGFGRGPSCCRMNNSTLLVNLVFGLAAAAAGAFLAVRIGQSVTLGYILAGIAIGPFSPAFVGDIEAVQELADIGIIFLMFSIGVQVSFRELLRVGKVAIGGGNLQVILTILVGYLAGVALGFGPLEAVFFGAVISNSSSTVLTKILSDRGELGSLHSRISLGWSSVQDLGTIIMVVVFTALAEGDGTLWTDLFGVAGRALVFIIILVPLGSIALPWLFERIASFRNRELFILTVATVALGTAYISTFFGLSLALGAFVAGIAVGESDLSLEIFGEIMPLRDVFAGLFFVSVGMLVDPTFVIQNVPLVLVAIALIVLAKGAISAIITVLFGYTPRTSLLVGVSLAQSAEFSFLLARLGTDLGVITPEVFNLILAGVASSMVLSPLLHQAASPVARWLDTHQPFSALETAPLFGRRQREMMRDHAVICGYGRVGRVVAGVLRQRGLPLVVIDEDQRVVRELRERQIAALLGNAANPVLLENVALERARVLVVATPDALTARQITDHVRHANPNLDIVVRTHSWKEREYLLRRGVGEAVMGELELALEMARHTLRRFGVSTLEAQAIVQQLRGRIGQAPSGDIEDFAA